MVNPTALEDMIMYCRDVCMTEDGAASEEFMKQIDRCSFSQVVSADEDSPSPDWTSVAAMWIAVAALDRDADVRDMCWFLITSKCSYRGGGSVVREQIPTVVSGREPFELPLYISSEDFGSHNQFTNSIDVFTETPHVITVGDQVRVRVHNPYSLKLWDQSDSAYMCGQSPTDASTTWVTSLLVMADIKFDMMTSLEDKVWCRHGAWSRYDGGRADFVCAPHSSYQGKHVSHR